MSISMFVKQERDMSIPAPVIYERLRRSVGFFPATECRLAAQPICRLDHMPTESKEDSDWYEFLIRPQGKFAHLSPDRFVRQMYAGDLGLDLDRMTAGVVIGWMAGQSRRLRASINIHPSSLGRPAFVDGLFREIDYFGLEPDQVCLELVEFAEPVSISRICEGVLRLKEAGVLLALDDFGKGMPNFELCGAGTVDYLKVDRSFIQQIGENPQHEALIRGIFAMASEMDIEVVAEGIEQEIQADVLRRVGVQWGQGYLLQRPRLIEV